MHVHANMRLCNCGGGTTTSSANNQVTANDNACPLLKNGCDDDWIWDAKAKSEEVVLYPPFNRTALFHPGWSNGTAAVRGDRALNGRRAYWELEISHRVFGTSIMFGVGTREARLHANRFTNLIGRDAESWGLSHKGLAWHDGVAAPYTRQFVENVPTTVGLFFDGVDGTLRFYKDGLDLGVAFRGFDKVQEQLFPIIASTAARSEIRLGVRKRNFVDLQDRCLTAIAARVRNRGEISRLPLPDVLRAEILGRVCEQNLDKI